MPDDARTPALLRDIDAERARLWEILTGKDESAMAKRPPNGKWSVLENVRHLLFAEQAHLGGFGAIGRPWSPLGFTPQAMRETRKLASGTDLPMPSVQNVLVAWEAIHASLASDLSCRESEEVRAALTKNLKHLRSHITIIERLIRTAVPAARVQ